MVIRCERAAFVASMRRVMGDPSKMKVCLLAHKSGAPTVKNV